MYHLVSLIIIALIANSNAEECQVLDVTVSGPIVTVGYTRGDSLIETEDIFTFNDTYHQNDTSILLELNGSCVNCDWFAHFPNITDGNYECTSESNSSDSSEDGLNSIIWIIMSVAAFFFFAILVAIAFADSPGCACLACCICGDFGNCGGCDLGGF